MRARRRLRGRPRCEAWRAKRASRGLRDSQASRCSTSGASELASGACSLLADRSAALSRRAAATSGLVVALANLRRVAAWSVKYFLPATDSSTQLRTPAHQSGNPHTVPLYCAKSYAVTNPQGSVLMEQELPRFPSRGPGRSHGVRHFGAAHAQRFRRAGSGVARGLMLHFRV